MPSLDYWCLCCLHNPPYPDGIDCREVACVNADSCTSQSYCTACVHSQSCLGERELLIAHTCWIKQLQCCMVLDSQWFRTANAGTGDEPRAQVSRVDGMATKFSSKFWILDNCVPRKPESMASRTMQS